MAPQTTPRHKDMTQAERKEEDARLDESLEETFPASDPSSVTRAPREKRETKVPPPGGADRKPPLTPGPDEKVVESSHLQHDAVKKNRASEAGH